MSTEDPELENNEYFVFQDFPKVKVYYRDNVIQAIKPSKWGDSQVINSYTDLPISLTVNDLPIVKGLRDFGFTIPQVRDKIPRFKAVVDAYVTIATESGEWGERWDGTEAWDNKNNPKGISLSSYNNIVKFFDVADAVGFYSLTDKRRKEKTVEIPTEIAEIKQQTDFDEFLKDPLIGEWRGLKWNPVKKKFEDFAQKFDDEDPDYAKQLRKAFILLDMTPKQYLAGTKDPKKAREIADKPVEKLKLITQRLREKTFKPVGIEAQRHDDMSLIDWVTSQEVPVHAEIENPKTGDKEIIKFSDVRSPKFTQGSRSIQKVLTKYLRHFGEQHGLIGVYSEDWSQKIIAPSAPDLDMPIPTLKKFDECLRNANYLKDHPDGIIYEQEAKLRENIEIAKQTRKIRQPDGSLKNYYKGNFVPIWLANDKFIPAAKYTGKIVNGKKQIESTSYYKMKKIPTTKENWKDAYLYFKVAMDLGWRAEEAFTSGANRSTEDDMTGIQELGDAERVEMGSKTDPITVLIMTRKTAEIAGRSHHGGNISWEDTKTLLREKRNHVEEYSNTEKYTEKQALDHGVVQFYEDRTIDYDFYKKTGKVRYGIEKLETPKKVENKIHALIGKDGEYTQVGTMEYPRTSKFIPEKIKEYNKNNWTIPRVVKVDQNRMKIRAIMRVCYAEVLPKDLYKKYFRLHSLHALRHLFAQYWLKATQGADESGTKDFSFVMEQGHWGGVDVLMNFYGKSSKTSLAKKQIKIQKGFDGIEDDQIRLKKEESTESYKKLDKKLKNLDQDPNVSDDPEPTQEDNPE